eukprot:8670395-Alexandrium_andersonii.AAC.1
MSASLVGSEMCIRDSDASGEVEREPCQGDLPMGAALWASISCTQQLGAPVSYTHLTLPTICSV